MRRAYVAITCCRLPKICAGLTHLSLRHKVPSTLRDLFLLQCKRTCDGFWLFIDLSSRTAKARRERSNAKQSTQTRIDGVYFKTPVLNKCVWTNRNLNKQRMFWLCSTESVFSPGKNICFNIEPRFAVRTWRLDSLNHNLTRTNETWKQ